MLREAAGRLKQVHFPRGARVFTQGQRMHEAFYLVLSGRVRLVEGVATGEPRILTYHGPGDVFGEIQLLTGGPALATAEAILDTVALALPFRAFHDILERHPAQALPLARLLGRRLKAWSSRTGRRRTTVFLGVHAGEASPESSLLVLGLARSLTRITASTTLVLDFAYGGPVPRGGGPGVLRALEEVLDARGHVERELLRQRVLHADDLLSYLILHLPPQDLEDLPPEVLPELLGEAKALSSYVVVRTPPRLGRAGTKLLEQLEHVVVAVTPEELATGGVREAIRRLPGVPLSVGYLGPDGGAVPSPSAFLEATGRERAFALPWRELSRRSIRRLTPYPREALEEGEEAMLQARALVRRVTRRRLGVCLGSGTALGWAHIGVLKVLVREGVAIDCLSGSSMGSIIASMLACGMTPDEMEATACGVTQATVDGWTDYNWPMMRDGLIKGDLVTGFLREIFGKRRIEDLEVPLLIQATDLVTGTPYYFREGPVVDAVRASVSLPGVFRPVHLEGHVLSDGGVHDTLPIGPLRELGADLVVAVNTTQSPEYSQLSVAEVKAYNVFDLFLRSLEIMQTERSRWEAEEADYVLRPRVIGPSWKELHRAREIIRFGEEEAERHLDPILAVLRAPP